MSLTNKDIQPSLNSVRKQFLNFEKNLELAFIVHTTGKRIQALNKAKIVAPDDAINTNFNKLLANWSQQKPSGARSELLGLLLYKTTLLGGLMAAPFYKGVICLNLEKYDDIESFESDLYRHCWHICHIIQTLKQPESDKKESCRIIIPKPKGMGQLIAQMKADVFAAICMSVTSQENYIIKFARWQAENTLCLSRYQIPEMNPFLMVLSHTEHLYYEFQNARYNRSHLLFDAYKSAEAIESVIDREKLKIWHRFAKACQDMACRRFAPETILYAAIDGCDDLEIKKLGMTLSNLLDLKPAEFSEGVRIYNPFINSAENARIHQEMTLEVFDRTLTRCIFENSGDAFLLEAVKQNNALIEGRFIGWCAMALQKAGQEFDQALRTNISPIHTTRAVFEQHLHSLSWQMIKELGEEILQLRKMNHDLDETEFLKLLSQSANYRAIRQSYLQSQEDFIKLSNTHTEVDVESDSLPINPEEMLYSQDSHADSTRRATA